MTREQAVSRLRRALHLSEQIAALAEGGDVSQIVSLDAERLQLLKSARSALGSFDEQSRSIAGQITALNDHTLGLLEHRRRAKGREMDMAAVGRRAVAAYGRVRMQR